MFAQINHLAIISENYATSTKFYETLFGMRTSPNAKPGRAITVGDGYVGLNINPRHAARPARLDHFGIDVADMEVAFERMRRKYPRVEWVKRPAIRPFANITTHDPDGNVFDLSQRRADNRRDIYAERDGVAQQRHVDHFAFRTMNPEEMAEFYCEIFELEPRNRAEGDPNHYLTDGHITMVIMPWHITDYLDTGIVSPGMDHIGFHVESVDKFKEDLDFASGENYRIAPYPLEVGAEGKARMEMWRRSCPMCQHHLTDVDGVLISVAEH
jgi:catechol 2,3-dioxygenase-like lactoylglutathione lyase family enzyme